MYTVLVYINAPINELLRILQAQEATTVILGCTELSLFTKDLEPCNKIIIDPVEILAKKIVEKSFLNNNTLIRR